jgi:hypothetical protein
MRHQAKGILESGVQIDPRDRLTLWTRIGPQAGHELAHATRGDLEVAQSRADPGDRLHEIQTPGIGGELARPLGVLHPGLE